MRDPNDDFLYLPSGFETVIALNSTAYITDFDMRGSMFLHLPGRPAIDMRATETNPIFGDFLSGNVNLRPTSMMWVQRTLADGSIDTVFLELAGAPLPTITTYAQFVAYKASITSGAEVFGGTWVVSNEIPLLSLPGATVVAGTNTGIAFAHIGPEPATLTRGAPDDTLTGGNGSDATFGGDGSDLIYGGVSIFGDQGDDRIGPDQRR